MKITTIKRKHMKYNLHITSSISQYFYFVMYILMKTSKIEDKNVFFVSFCNGNLIWKTNRLMKIYKKRKHLFNKT